MISNVAGCFLKRCFLLARVLACQARPCELVAHDHLTLIAWSGTDAMLWAMSRGFIGNLTWLALLLALPAGSASAAPRRYAIDPASSRVLVHVGRSGLLGFAGHEHEVIAPVHDGVAVIDLDHPETSSVELTIRAAALHVTGQGEPPGDVPKVQQAMLGPECLDAARFPTIRFVSKAVAVGGKGGGALDLALRGDLTIHGVTREVLVPVRVLLGAGAVTVTGTTKLRQTQFGIQPISKAGVVNVKDELLLEWHLEARPTP
jgi:polyisoprenoid-binding protein YceI